MSNESVVAAEPVTWWQLLLSRAWLAGDNRNVPGLLALTIVSGMFMFLGWLLIRIYDSPRGRFSIAEFGGSLMISLGVLVFVIGACPSVTTTLQKMAQVAVEKEPYDPPRIGVEKRIEKVTFKKDGAAAEETIQEVSQTLKITNAIEAKKIYVLLELTAVKEAAELVLPGELHGKVWFKKGDTKDAPNSLATDF